MPLIPDDSPYLKDIEGVKTSIFFLGTWLNREHFSELPLDGVKNLHKLLESYIELNKKNEQVGGPSPATE